MKCPRIGHLISIALIVLLACAGADNALAQREAQTSWWDRAEVVTSTYYRIKSDLPRDELREIALHLDRTFEAYRLRLGSLRQNLPASFDVLVFAKQDDYLTTLRFNYGVNATGSGGIFFANPRGSALAFFIENLPVRRVQHVVQHEGFHQVAFALFGGGLPPWANEGLAEFFGEGIMVDDALVIGQTNPRVLDHIKQAIETERTVPFLHMLQMDGQQWNLAVQSGDAKLQYEQAWSMVHFLIYAENGKYAVAFSNYLRLLNSGLGSYDAFVRAFGTDDIASFEARWKEFALNAQASAFTTAMERAEFLAAGLVELSRQKVYPETIEQLREALRAIAFEYTTQQHGVATTLSAQDDALYTIPRDDLTPADGPDPAFVLEETLPRRISPKERRLNLDNPFPPTLKTIGLQPREVHVRWLRDLERNEFTFLVSTTR
ncbi:MAG: DUF1570 domain-containing protein [Phycisphaerales bacterium]